ncbi:NAD-P-binding protein [Trametes elegans]|nr:NAD-P-binding protein [Trametes elegans]
MSSDKLTVFLAGATGYIGGSVLQRLLQHPNAKNFAIISLVRNVEKAKLLEKDFGVKTVIGSLQDHDKLANLAENAHVVFQVASSDDIDATKAILSGLKRRHEKTGDLPLLIHTSGTGEFADYLGGEAVSEKIYSDLDIPALEALPPTALHRPVDLLIVAADGEGYVRTHIVMPPFVYGIASGPLFDAGISNKHTTVVPLWVRAALQRGTVGELGKGVSVWGTVHVDDTADLQIRLFDALLSDPSKVSHGREGYFFAANGENHAIDALKVIGNTLYALGRISTPEPVPYAPEELSKYLISEELARLIFTNSRPKAERARLEVGWTPKYTNEDFIDGLKGEVELIVEQEDAKKSS